MSVRTDAATLEGLREFDTATLFNAIRRALGGGPEGEGLEAIGGVPVNYTDQSIRCLLPEFGTAVGYAVTFEVAPNYVGPERAAVGDQAEKWAGYYDYVERTPGPLIAVMKDVDERPGRGAITGDAMVAQLKLLGVVGVVADASVRDVAGIRRVGVPIWATGQVSGHGLFHLVDYDRPVVAADLPIDPGDLLVADADGVLKFPAGVDPAEVLEIARGIRVQEEGLHAEYARPGATLASVREYMARHF